MTSENKNSLPAASRERGFTLLEVMLVLALIAIVFAGMTPLVSATMRERKLRSAAEDIGGLVRTQRSLAQDDGRRHVLEIRPQGFYERGSVERGEIDKQVYDLPKATQIYVRYPGGEWEKPGGQFWEFSPIGMVTPLSVRLEKGDAWIEVDFDLLTGRIAEERYAF